MAGHGESVRKPPAVAGWVALAVAAAVAWASIRAIEPKLEALEEVPPSQFSAARAFRDVEALARASRPLGSRGHAAARDHVAGRLGELGLEVELERSTVVVPIEEYGLLAAPVVNVVGRRSGAGGVGRLTLSSHYDSQPQTWGAGDAASGVATILETLRALGEDWRPGLDVEVVITDGEEIGLLGARAHLEGLSPVEQGPDVVLNFEARGQRGPVAMFETSAGNLGLLELFGRAAPRPFASSLSYEVYRRMPNDSDFTVFRRGGASGLNFAFIAGHPAYHSRLDSAARLSLATLEQEGVNALALVRELTAGVAPVATEDDAVYFNPWGTTFLLYPASWAWPLCLAILVAVGALLTLLRMRQGVRWSGALAGAGLWGLAAAAASCVGWLFRLGLERMPGLLRAPHAEAYDFRAFVAVLALLVGAASIAIWALRGSRVRAGEALAGCLLFWSVLLVLATAWLPGASYLAAWPIGFLGLGAVLVSVGPPRGPLAVLVLAFAACPGLAVWAPTADVVFQALGFGDAPVLAPTLALCWSLLALPVWAVAARRGGRAAALLLAAGLAVGGALVLRDEPSIDRPGVDTLSWLQDADGAARWFSLDAAVDDWTAGYVDGRSLLPEVVTPGLEVLTGPAGELALPPPRIVVAQDEVRDGNRRLVLRLRSARGAQVLRALLRPGAPVAALRIGGRLVEEQQLPEDEIRLVLHGFGADGAEIVLELGGAAPVEAELADQAWGLPEEVLTSPRPVGLIPTPSWLTDSTFVLSRRRL